MSNSDLEDDLSSNDYNDEEEENEPLEDIEGSSKMLEVEVEVDDLIESDKEEPSIVEDFNKTNINSDKFNEFIEKNQLYFGIENNIIKEIDKKSISLNLDKKYPSSKLNIKKESKELQTNPLEYLKESLEVESYECKMDNSSIRTLERYLSGEQIPFTYNVCYSNKNMWSWIEMFNLINFKTSHFLTCDDSYKSVYSSLMYLNNFCTVTYSDYLKSLGSNISIFS